jgi:mannose-6-phosphate isomerase-like protein (cupin superfamily)
LATKTKAGGVLADSKYNLKKKMQALSSSMCQICHADFARFTALGVPPAKDKAADYYDSKQQTFRVCSPICQEIAGERYPLTGNPRPAQLDAAVRRNRHHFRIVIYTGTVAGAATQLVAMCLSYETGTRIGWEVHPLTSQYFLVKAGSGVFHEQAASKSTDVKDASRIPVLTGSAWMVQPGTYHDVETTGDDGWGPSSGERPLHLLTIYTPPHHAPNVRDTTRRAAEIREAGMSDAGLSTLQPALGVGECLIRAQSDPTLKLLVKHIAQGTSPDATQSLTLRILQMFDIVPMKPGAREALVDAAREQQGVILTPLRTGNIPASVDLPRGPGQIFRIESSGVYVTLVPAVPYLTYQ